MTFEELLAKVRGMAAGFDHLDTQFLAVQVNITGDHSGVFYIEIKDGHISIEPYEYNDRNCAVTVSMSNFNKLLDGKADAVALFTVGKLKVDGDIGKALEFANLLKQKKK